MFKNIIFLFLILSNFAQAESFYVESINDENKTPTQIHYFKGKESRALILMLPGGNGGPGPSKPNFWHNQIFIALADKNLTSGNYDIAIMENPFPMEDKILDGSSAGMRSQKDHLLRIESSIKYLKSKTKLPLILRGHSNGGLSVMSFVEYIEKNPEKKNLVQGIIMSGAKNDSNKYLGILNIPVIFLHHKNDGCVGTKYENAVYGHERMSKKNKAYTTLITIESGSAGTSDPCRDGYHMYFGAELEVQKKLSEELKKISF